MTIPRTSSDVRRIADIPDWSPDSTNARSLQAFFCWANPESCSSPITPFLPDGSEAVNLTSGPTDSVIGPDGTYYALVPASTSTRQAPVTELVAIAATTGSIKWTTDINGEVDQVLPGLNDVYAVQTVSSGSGKSATTTTSVLVIPTGGPSGTPATITPPGNISNIQIKTVAGSASTDYLYIYSVTTTSSSSGGTTTFTTTQTLTIYTNGTNPKTVTIP